MFNVLPEKKNYILQHSEAIPTKELAFYNIRRQSVQREFHFMTFGGNPYEGNFIL